MDVVFFGSPLFSAKVLHFLKENSVKIIAIVTQPDRQKGRSQRFSAPFVKIEAQKSFPSIPVFQPEKASEIEFLKRLKGLKADLFLVVAYGQILKQELLDIPKFGCINVHTSLLPKYRGAAPIQRAIMAGEKKTGITIMRIIKKLDAGAILKKVEVSIEKEMIFSELENVLCEKSGPAILDVMQNIENIKGEQQDESMATYAPKITPEECLIDFNRPADQVHNHIRSLSKKPGAYFFIRLDNGLKRIKVLRSKVVEQKACPYQNINFTKDGWVIGCSDNAIEILELQAEGKKPMSFSQWFVGLKSSVEIEKEIPPQK